MVGWPAELTTLAQLSSYGYTSMVCSGQGPEPFFLSDAFPQIQACG